MQDAYPTLNGPVPDACGTVLTAGMFDRLRALLTSDEYRERQRQAEEERHLQLKAMNDELLRRYASSLGKMVAQLTKQDRNRLNEKLFQAWLQLHGVTESDFWEWWG